MPRVNAPNESHPHRTDRSHTEFVGVEKARTHSHDATHVAHQKEGRSEARMYAQLRAATLRLAALATLAIPVL
eukprot:scaffold70274_cov66-Phaeocystis_antarctica.AAC.4